MRRARTAGHARRHGSPPCVLELVLDRADFTAVWAELVFDD
ncbi:hypothetical protein [Saccharothrix stipae]